jgi:magnesium-transporting ATPase (P-type)
MKKVSSVIVVLALAGIFLWGISFNFQTPAIAGSIKLADGTVVVVRTLETLNPENLAPGDIIKFEVAEDIKADGIVLIRKGTAARGEVISAEKTGYVGKGGKIGITVTSTTAIDGQKVPLKGSLTRSGEEKTGTSVAVSALVCPLALLMKGEAAQIPAGSQISAYVDNNVTVNY